MTSAGTTAGKWTWAKCVYQGKQTEPVEERAEETNTTEVVEETTTEPVEEPVEQPKETADKAKPAVKQYRLKALMNVRRAASTNAERVDSLQAGTIVSVVAIENDWLHLANGTYILFDQGKFAEQV